MKKIIFHKKEKRFNPHIVWTICCSLFIIFVIIELLVFSWYFVHITTKLDAPATPTHETNAAAIAAMGKILDSVEHAVTDRSGNNPSSQNSAPVVQ